MESYTQENNMEFFLSVGITMMGLTSGFMLLRGINNTPVDFKLTTFGYGVSAMAMVLYVVTG